MLDVRQATNTLYVTMSWVCMVDVCHTDFFKYNKFNKIISVNWKWRQPVLLSSKREVFLACSNDPQHILDQLEYSCDYLVRIGLTGQQVYHSILFENSL